MRSFWVACGRRWGATATPTRSRRKWRSGAGGGAIVNVATTVAHFGLPGASAYGASKAALVSLTQTWAAEYGPQGVRVNAVSAGTTRTEGTAAMGEIGR